MESEGGGKMLKNERMSLSKLDEISDLRDRIQIMFQSDKVC